MPFTSEPASGSVTATAVMTSPEMMPGIHLSFCASLPERKTWMEAISEWTRAVVATPLKVERPSSSANTTVASVSISDPP